MKKLEVACWPSSKYEMDVTIQLIREVFLKL